MYGLEMTAARLDFSVNCLEAIPWQVQWGQLKGLNLSDNAFVEWPTQIAEEQLPELEFLSLAGNAIGSAPDRNTGFPAPRLL
jgi:hypothetical protein